VYDVKCGHGQRGEGGLIKCGHLRTGGGGRKRGRFLRTSFMDDPLTVLYHHGSTKRPIHDD